MADPASSDSGKSPSIVLREAAEVFETMYASDRALILKDQDAYKRLPASLWIPHHAAVETFCSVSLLRGPTSDPYLLDSLYLFQFQLLLMNYRTLRVALPLVQDEFCAVADGPAEWEGFTGPSWHNILLEISWAYLDAAFMAIPRSLPDGSPGEREIWEKWQNKWDSITHSEMAQNAKKFQEALAECKFPSRLDHMRIDARLQQEVFRAAQNRLAFKREYQIDAAGRLEWAAWHASD